MIQIAIGTQTNEYIGQKVLEHSIRKHTSEELDIRFVTQALKRVGGQAVALLPIHPHFLRYAVH